VFLFRSILTTVIVSFGSLVTAIMMHIEDNAGNRETVLFVAFLIALSNMQMTDLGLGKINELLWIDIFNIVQLALVTVAILETITVHYLFVTNHQALALHIDNVCHFTLPALYVGVTLGLFMMVRADRPAEGTEGQQDGIIMIAVCSAVLIPLTVFLTWLRATAFSRRRKRAVQALQSLTVDDGNKYDLAVRKIFKTFDLDGSGELEMDECRELMQYLKPNIKRDEMLKVMEYMRRYADHATGALTEADFADALFDLVVNGKHSLRITSTTSEKDAQGSKPQQGSLRERTNSAIQKRLRSAAAIVEGTRASKVSEVAGDNTREGSCGEVSSAVHQLVFSAASPKQCGRQRCRRGLLGAMSGTFRHKPKEEPQRSQAEAPGPASSDMLV